MKEKIIRFQDILEAVQGYLSEADIVLFDSPPVLAVTDAAVLASRLDGVLLVNDSGRTRRSMAQRAVEGLRKVSANLLGVVLNRLSSASGGYSYYHYYYYSESDDGRQKRRRRRPKETTSE